MSVYPWIQHLFKWLVNYYDLKHAKICISLNLSDKWLLYFTMVMFRFFSPSFFITCNRSGSSPAVATTSAAGQQQFIIERYWEVDRLALWATVSRLRGPHTAGADPTGAGSTGVHLPRRPGTIRGRFPASGGIHRRRTEEQLSSGTGEWVLVCCSAI